LGDARVLGRCLLGLSANEQVLVYVGSLGGSYMLNEMLDFFRAFREARSGARFLFVTSEPEQMIVAEASARGLAREELIIRSATRDEVPALIAAGDLGIAFKQPSFSAKGCSPTKVGEMLAMGLPVVANSGVGDVDATIEPGATGAIVHSFTPDAYRDAIGTVGGIALDREGIREAARRRFDLEDGVKAYDEIYRSLSRSGRRACGG
jgi:glycosyltransferase involved in cell wall biosynthesis